MGVCEVFRQDRKGQPFEHAGSVVAPDEGLAEVYARELYSRRQESEALWLVAREAIRALEPVPAEFDLSYRRVDGYSLRLRLREARAALGKAESR